MRAIVPLALAAFACSPKPPPPAPVQTIAPPVVAPAPPPAAAVEKDYPPTRRDNVIDRLHGTEVKDPYRWLEDPGTPEVASWMAAQDGYARDHLAKLEGRDAIGKLLADVMYYDSVTAPIHRNGRYFYMRKHKDKEKRVVYWKTGENGAEKVLLDPNTWSTDGSAGLK